MHKIESDIEVDIVLFLYMHFQFRVDLSFG